MSGDRGRQDAQTRGEEGDLGAKWPALAQSDTGGDEAGQRGAAQESPQHKAPAHESKWTTSMPAPPIAPEQTRRDLGTLLRTVGRHQTMPNGSGRPWEDTWEHEQVRT